MDYLIRRKATGTPDEFSRKMNLSKRSLMVYLQSMKFLRFPIKYDKTRGTYYYENEGKMTDEFFVKSHENKLSKEEQKKIMGGDFNIKEWCSNNALWKNNFVQVYIHCRELNLGATENL